jgi:hypothetical protein
MTKNALIVLGGVATAAALFLLRGMMPELVRYFRIRRM